MMPYLPPDVGEEILARLPATSLKRLRSTCKRWNALYKEPRFTEKHFRKAPKQFLILILKEFKVCLMNVNLNVAPPTIDFKSQLGLKDSYSNSHQVDRVFHCGGLLLCTTKDDENVVWNPCLGETRWIQLMKTGDMSSYKLALGYENKNSCHSYKILKYCDNLDPNHGVVKSEIYEFTSDSWRVLDDATVDCFTGNSGVSLKGNTFWLSSDKDFSVESYFLLSFDFTTERFRRMCLLPFESFGCSETLSVVRDEQLSLLHSRNYSSKIDMWVTNKIDNEAEALVLWRKSFTVDLNIHVTGFSFYLTFLIDEAKKMVVCCNPGYGEKRKKMIYIIGEDDECYTEFPFVKTRNKKWFAFIDNYIPSLVHIQQGRV